MTNKKPLNALNPSIPITTGTTTNGASAALATVVTVKADQGLLRTMVQVKPGPNARLKESALATTEDILHGLVSHPDLLDFAERIESHPVAQALLQMPLPLSVLPTDVAQKIRECIHVAKIHDRSSTSKLHREVLCVSAMLVCLAYLWDQDVPTSGLAMVHSVAKAAMEDLQDSQPTIAHGIQVLVGWGDVDEQYEEAMVWLRNVVKVQMLPTVRQLSALAFMAAKKELRHKHASQPTSTLNGARA